MVIDPLVQHIGDNQPLRDTDVDRVRSVESVEWAAPLYVGSTQARLLGGGATQSVTLVGLDADTLAGAPTNIVDGSLLDLRRAQGVIVMTICCEDERATRMRLGLGEVFEMNDREAVIVGIAKVTPGMQGAVYVFTTWDRAKEYAPGQRKMLTHILAAPAPGNPIGEVARAISEETGLKAVSETEFKEMSIRWMLIHSPIPIVVGLMVGVGFIIGLGVSGQTFYTFVLENTRHLGALKAMGVGNRTLTMMIMAQAGIVGFAGFGLGVGLISTFFSLIPEGSAPMVMLWPIPVIVFVAIMLICMATALLSVWRVTRIEPAIVFRS